MESKHIIIILIVIALMISSAMIGMYANQHIADKKVPVNNTTNSTVAVTNDTDNEQTDNVENPTETSNTKQNTNNNHNPNHQEDVSYVTYYPDEEESVSESSSSYDSEIYVDDRGRVSIGHWDDEGYWNAEYVV